MTSFPVLTTKRLRLREIVPDDAASLFAIHSDAVGMQWFGSNPMTELPDADKLIQLFADWWRNQTGIRWGIERLSDSAFLGTCGLFRWNRNWRSCVAGYELTPAARGEGYMNEALLAALRYGFETMQLNRVEAQVHPLNAPSIRALETLGFRREGFQRQAGYWNNAYHDLLQFALLAGEFQAHP